MSYQKESSYTGRQLRVIAEIQRIALILGADRLSQRDFDKHHRLAGLSTAGYQFGSWNKAVEAAGLQPYEPGQSNVGPKISDTILLKEIFNLHRELGKRPSEREMARFGKFSPKPYRDRWGSWVAAREAAYQSFGESVKLNVFSKPVKFLEFLSPKNPILCSINPSNQRRF